MEAVRPPRIDALPVRIEIAPGINQPVREHRVHLPALLVCKACMAAVGLRILQVDFLVRDVQIAAVNDRFYALERLYVSKECVLPGHPV